MKKFKRTAALLMAFGMAFSAAACSKDSTDPTGSTDGTNAPNESNPSGGGDSSVDPTGGANTGADTYTYNYAVSVFPTVWNPHQYKTADDSVILDYASVGFYTFDYNDTRDGYKIVPVMATADPVDVTADYVGQFGIEEGASALAWKITLRDDIKWEDGTAISAGDFVTSAKLLLNPVAGNYRADSLYQGSLAIVNAKNYVYAGQHAYADYLIPSYADEEYVADNAFDKNDDGVYLVNGGDVVINLYDGGNWGSYGLDDYYGAYPECYEKDGVDLYETVLAPAANDDGYVQITDEVAEALMYIIANLQGFDDVEAYAEATGDYAYIEWQEFCYVGSDYPELDFSEVGIFTTGDNELVLVLESPLEGFYLLYNLMSSWLVNEKLYTECESLVDGVYTNTYGTSVDTFMSYGPYKLTSFQADKEFVMERNENYFGFVDGQYQTTHIVVSFVEEATTRLEMFLQGKLDTYGLTTADIETYGATDYTYYTSGDSTWFIAFNPELSALESMQANAGNNINKTILTVKEFRQAMSYALDRSGFSAAVLPLNGPAFGLFSDLILSDPDTSTFYRETEEAKWVLARFWGLSDDIGAGKMYETVDDAVDGITGLNLEMAKEKFNEAYDIAIESGLMDEDDVIEIKVGLPTSTSAAYNQGYEFLVNCYTEAVKGTSLEGKLTFTKDDTLGNGFADALRANSVDMLFLVGWTGSALDPYGLMEAYTSSGYQYDPSWDTTKAPLEVEIDGVAYTASVWDWTMAISGGVIDITDADGNTKEFSAGSSDKENKEARFQILVELENIVLEQYNMIPMLEDRSANLKGMQIQYGTEEYIYPIGRGGVQYMTYNYTDAEWEQYVSDNNGTLNYN